VYENNKILFRVNAPNGAKFCSVIRAKCKENGRQGDCENAFPRIQECRFEYPVNQSGKYLFITFDSLFLNQHTYKVYYINYTQQDYYVLPKKLISLAGFEPESPDPEAIAMSTALRCQEDKNIDLFYLTSFI
jgi:hypothetical protein